MSIIIVGVGQAEFDGERNNQNFFAEQICIYEKKNQWKPVCCVFASEVVLLKENINENAPIWLQRHTGDYRLIKHLLCVAMVELDGDDIRISSRGKLAERDIVQVRPF